MDKNQQDKVESGLIATEDKPSIPSLPPKDKEKLDHLRKKQGKESNERTGVSGKTLWNWLSLLLQILGVIAIPLAIIIGTTYFSTQQNQTSTQIAQDQQAEASLQTYLNRMSDLLLNHNLRTSKPGDEVSQVARELTLTTLRRLDSVRNGIILQFLQDEHLIGGKNAVIDLSGAILSGAYLMNTNLSGVTLSGTTLNNTWLGSANLSGANLSHANLTSTDLGGANLKGANLSGANLASVNLYNADLSGANLNGAIVAQDELTSAASLHGTTMPDGSLHL
jgi:uncharacterized protein YjbI with pentapeptide repeats